MIIYFAFINLLSAAVCIADKWKAIKHKSRIRERTLWVLSLLYGSVGMYLTMHAIRHKTQHMSFMFGLPLLIIFQIFLVLLLTKLIGGHIIA